MRHFVIVFILFQMCFMSPISALPFRCDKDQNKCEVATKRWTIGDKIAIFTSDKQLVAIGQIIEIQGHKRIAKLTKKWAILLRSYEMDIISDNQFNDPEKSFTTVTPLSPKVWNVALGLYNLGIGNGFVSMNLEGAFYRHFWRDMSWFARVHYLSGSGRGSDNLGNTGAPEDGHVTSFGISGGVSKMLLPYNPFSIRIDGDVGISQASVDIDTKKLNNRIEDGVGTYARASASAIWRRDGLQPEVGVAFLLLHRATSAGLLIGVNSPL